MTESLFFAFHEEAGPEIGGWKQKLQKTSTSGGSILATHSQTLYMVAGVFTLYHGNPQPSFLGVLTHMLGVQNHHFSWFCGPKVNCISWTTQFL